MSVDITNDADDGESDSEQLIIDGETTTIALSIRRRVHERLELGIDVPYVQHSGGTLDGFIKDWHSMLGLSNFRRDGPNDQLRHAYISDGETLFSLDSVSIPRYRASVMYNCPRRCRLASSRCGPLSSCRRVILTN
jgi:hypothetical protein